MTSQTPTLTTSSSHMPQSRRPLRAIITKRRNTPLLIVAILVSCIYCIVKTLPGDQTGGHSLQWAATQTTLFAHAQHQRFVDSSTVKPSLVLILPQSFKVPTRPSLNDNDNHQIDKLQQYLAIVNNAQDDQTEERIRGQYKRLSLQVRDARTPITGQLFFEHVFDYFPADSPNHLLIPIDLSQVSLPLASSAVNSNNAFRTHSYHRHRIDSSVANMNSLAIDHDDPINQPQQLIVSIRPHQLDSGFGSDGIELVSSAPILVEQVPSRDGRRSFSIVQTDKPIYKPNEKVRIRAMIVNENLRPIIGDELRMQIKNPDKMVVEEVRFPRASINDTMSNSGKQPEPTYLDHTFEFPPEPMLGSWSVQLLHNDPIANDTTIFEVREYVLPPFEMTFESPENILPTTRYIVGAVVAKYHYGKPVQGKVTFKFGFRFPSATKTKFVARTYIKSINSATGRAEYNITSDRFRDTEWFPAVNGARLVVEATVTETSTGHRETVQDTGTSFIQMPYKISFQDSIDDFRPGLTQHLAVQLVDMLSLRPGPSGQRLIAFYQDQNNTYLGGPTLDASKLKGDKFDTEAITNSEGRALFKIGPIRPDVTSLTITIKLMNSGNTLESDELYKSHRYTGNELAIDHHTLFRHDSQNGWISLMNKSVTHVNVGDQFESDLLLSNTMVIPTKIFYTIVSKGQIVLLDKINKNGLVSFKVTEEMIPSIRLVLFALTHDSIGMLSDSMRINVDQDLGCGMKLAYKSYDKQQVMDNTMRPNDHGRLDIFARQGDLVSLIGVDNAIYSLNNRTRSIRIIERIRSLDTGCGFGGGRNNLDVFYNAGLTFHSDVTDTIHSAGGANSAQIGSSCLSVANQMKYAEEAAMGYTKPMLSLLGRAMEVAQRIRWPSGHSRSKREVDIEIILRRYKNSFHKACCKLGTLEDIPQKRNCTVRKKIVEKYMQHSKICSSIYYDCCRNVFGEPDVKLSAMFPSGFPEEQIESRNAPPVQHAQPVVLGQLDKIEEQTLVRKDFRETWLFDIVDVQDPSGFASLDVRLPHSISSWSISALALNPNKPMCVMPRPFRMNTFQEIFIHLSIPYKVVQGEQIDMIVTLFNYSPKNQDVLVYMYGVDGVCSDAEPGERSERRRIRVDKHSSQALIFSMIPLRIGQFPIKVVAITLSSNFSDIIERELNVVPRGKTVTDETTFTLDPMNQQRRSKRAIQTGNLLDDIDSTRGLQYSRVRLAPSRESDNIVPQTQECIVSAIGDRMGQTVETTILDVENLIRLPHGCGEQVMIYLGPTLYTAKYLSSINKLTGDLRWRSIRYIQSGYKRILNYRRDDGAFASFPDRDPSVWLTAYVTKMLCQTERTSYIANEVHIDKTVINSALNWLINIQNKETGTWVEKNPVYHREMLGGVLKENALSAFVLLSLNECIHHSQDIVEEIKPDKEVIVSASTDQNMEETNGVDNLRVAIQRAEDSLVLDRYRALREKNPYVLALVAYSLSYSRPRDASAVLNDLMSLSDKVQAKNHVFWRGQYPIETAAYALQALIELAPMMSQSSMPIKYNWMPGSEALAIANWLSSRRSYSGAFESTQDTVVALEALSKFSQLQSTPSGNALIPQTPQDSASLMCNVTMSNRTRRSLEFGKENAQILRTIRLDSFDLDPMNGETLDIITSGSGLGTMSVKLKYNVFQENDELCRFDIDSSIEEWQPPKITSSHDIQVVGDDSKLTLSQVPTNESTFEEDFFKTFDKSMLNELNLISSNQPGSVQQQRRQQRPEHVYLRTKRYAAVLELSNTNDTANSQLITTESWTSRVVSSLRSWIAPKAATDQLPGSNINQSPDRNTAPRRNGTSRRSAQAPAPMVTSNSMIPSDAHLNTLSSEFDINGQNKTNVTANSDMLENSSRRLVLLLRVCAHHMSSQKDSEMAVIEVGILSGFKPNEADLAEIKKDPGTLVDKYELSADRSLVIMYLRYIPYSGPYCFQFRLVRDSIVYNLQSGYIRVYEYYSPTHSCSDFYTPSRVNNLIETRCDPSGQVCQCASKSLCPATKKLLDLSEIHQVNATNARNQLVDLVCSNKYDLVSLVRLKGVRYMEAAKIFKLSLRVKSDLKGNLTNIMDVQRQQKAQMVDSVRKPQHGTTELGTYSYMLSDGSPPTSLEDNDESSLDYLNLSIDSSCIRDDPLMLHLAHPSQWKQGGELMILFARSDKLEKRYFKTAPKMIGGRQLPSGGPKPKPNLFSVDPKWQQSEVSLASFDDAQNQQYSLTLPLDKNAILHDVTYQAKVGPRESINNLILWLDLKSRRERWSCPS